MGSLTWYRAARRAVGLSSQPEYPNLEALLEAEASQPHSGYFYAARIVPPVGIVVGNGVFVPLAMNFSPLFYIGAVGLSVVGGGLGILFNFLDRSLSPAKKHIRRQAHMIWGRYGIGSLIGTSPVISPVVGQVLDEAASIYMRHAQRKSSTEVHRRAFQALEVAMARLMELAAIENAQNQELEFDSGWALPLLQEMRQMDTALARLTQFAPSGSAPVDPLANLRDARAEVAGIVSAIDELDQQQSA
ncbi:hypothetical protein [Fimbriimonas ginsengisoli]|uniref:hypothetical protein n=1 Tax=Fimbriimonas ginsengisoli TaxID=1005039 RepID=UPI0004B492CA|nr:hypothetical protein [Fimbriimonas ginsengisoli]